MYYVWRNILASVQISLDECTKCPIMVTNINHIIISSLIKNFFKQPANLGWVTMAFPFVDDPVDEEAALLHREYTSGDDTEPRHFNF